MNIWPAWLSAFLTCYACLKPECPLTRTARLPVNSMDALQNTTSPSTPKLIPSFKEGGWDDSFTLRRLVPASQKRSSLKAQEGLVTSKDWRGEKNLRTSVPLSRRAVRCTSDKYAWGVTLHSSIRRMWDSLVNQTLLLPQKDRGPAPSSALVPNAPSQMLPMEYSV